MKKAFVPPLNLRYLKRSSHVHRNSEITVSPKRRLTDTVIWKGNHIRVNTMIKKFPLELWKMLHNRQKGQKSYSLVPAAYAVLKNRINELKPELVEKVNEQRNHHKAVRRLKKEISTGHFGTSKGRFKKIGANKGDK